MPSSVTTHPPLTRDQAGRGFETALKPGRRKQQGQHFTPDALCDWMIGIADLRPGDRILDPACGTGAFLLRTRAALETMGVPTAAMAKQLLGMELDPEAATLCRQQLAFSENSVFTGDFLTQTVWPENAIDVILGNPPYVRQEIRTGKDHAPREQCGFEDYLQHHPDQRRLFGRSADLYIRFLIEATRLLKPGGRLVFVLSNSWLNTALGEQLLRFLAHHYQLGQLVETTAEAWFPDAAVRPVILSATRRPGWRNDFKEETVQCVTLSQPLRQLLSDPKGQPPTGDTRVVSLFDLIGRQHHQPLASRASFLLRCPEALARALAGIRDGFVPLSTLAAVRYPVKTGINAFFYVTPEIIRQFGIEPDYLLPVLKSARQARGLELNPAESPIMLFHCPHPPELLRKKKHQGALGYIHWGRGQLAPVRQKRDRAVPWPEVASVQGRPYWYQVPKPNASQLFAPRFVDQSARFLISDTPMVADQTFYTLHPQSTDRVLLAALLNTSLTRLLLALNGRTSLGDGVLQFSREDIARLAVPMPCNYPKTEKQAIMEAFGALAARPDETAARHLLDRAVLAPLFRQDWQDIQAMILVTLEQLTTERRRLAHQRKRLQKENGNLLTQITAEERKESE
ncbi:MAG: class I SAM-dependent DNA methyltransferase [Candidatus Melainabacteria bacterium]